MCLDKLAKFPPCKTGYKVYYKCWDGDLFSECRTPANHKPILRNGELMHEYDYRPLYGKDVLDATKSSDTYRTGFHVFHTLYAARRWHAGYHRAVIARVEVVTPIVTGLQDGFRITVAKKVRVLGIVQRVSR